MSKKIFVFFVALSFVATTAFAAAAGFKDVKPGSWFYPYVMKASEMGIIDGYADNTFKPNQEVTRAQLAKIMVSYDEKLISTLKANSADEQKVISAISKAAPLLVYLESDYSFGSGFFVAADIIMTNEHVIRGASAVKVKTANGEELSGTVIARDQYKDIALVKVPKKFNYMTFNTSLTVGQTAIALGHPLGQYNTVTKGMISKLNITDYKASNMFQFDAPINAGNSGGMVINSNGQVIGMTTGKIIGDIDGTAAEGLAFAIRAYDLKKYLDANK